MDEPSSCDFLSDLPLGIIHSILELVPIRDAVKTSVLSSQWRYKWATLPHLAFDDECGSNESRRIDFINQVLFLHRGPIHKVTLRVTFMEDDHYITQWLLFLSRYDIRILILSGMDDEAGYWIFVHSSLYSYKKLIHLELCQCELPPPPSTFNGFLHLRRLYLNDVAVSSSTVQSLLANSPLLEELLLNSSESLELRIHAPNLKYLELGGVCKYISLYAPLLIKMRVRDLSDFTAEHRETTTSAANRTQLLGNLTNLQELVAGHAFLWCLSRVTEIFYLDLMFHHLSIIELQLVDVPGTNPLSVVVRLITCSPNLQKLKFSILDRAEGSSVSSLFSCLVPSLFSFFAPNFTFQRLKVFEMENVHVARNEKEFIKYLLASSPVLEKMILNPHQDLTDQQQSNVTTELLTYHRASPNAEILYGKR